MVLSRDQFNSAIGSSRKIISTSMNVPHYTKMKAELKEHKLTKKKPVIARQLNNTALYNVNDNIIEVE